MVGRSVTAADLKDYFCAILLRMVALRDQASSSQWLESVLKPSYCVQSAKMVT